jgi:hypothetical protein
VQPVTEFDLRPPADQVFVDLRVVEDYVRDSKLALTNAVAYVALIGSFALLRVAFDVPYLRAALGLYVVVSLLGIVAKLRLSGLDASGHLLRYAGGAAAGLVVGLPVLLTLVEANRGTLFAETAAGLVAVTVTHVVDRVTLARG